MAFNVDLVYHLKSVWADVYWRVLRERGKTSLGLLVMRLLQVSTEAVALYNLGLWVILPFHVIFRMGICLKLAAGALVAASLAQARSSVFAVPLALLVITCEAVPSRGSTQQAAMVGMSRATLCFACFLIPDAKLY